LYFLQSFFLPFIYSSKKLAPKIYVLLRRATLIWLRVELFFDWSNNSSLSTFR